MQDTFAIGYWITKHKPKIQKILLGIAIASLALLYLNIMRLGWIYFRDKKTAETIYNTIQEQSINFKNIPSPENLKTVRAKSLHLSGNGDQEKIDAFLEVQNTNTRWYAQSITYQMSISGFTSDTLKTFILPEETKFFVIHNVSGNTMLTPSLTVLDVQWKKIPLQKQDIRLSVEKAEYHPVFYEDALGYIQGEVITEIENKNIYGFREVQNIALVIFQDEIIGIGEQKVARWNSSERQTLRFGWPKKFPVSSKVQILSSTDILNPENLILPGE